MNFVYGHKEGHNEWIVMLFYSIPGMSDGLVFSDGGVQHHLSLPQPREGLVDWRTRELHHYSWRSVCETMTNVANLDMFFFFKQHTHQNPKNVIYRRLLLILSMQCHWINLFERVHFAVLIAVIFLILYFRDLVYADRQKRFTRMHAHF